MNAQITIHDEGTADISVEPGFATSTGEQIPTRVRLDVWSYGDGASLYLTPHQARLVSNALWSAAGTAEDKPAPRRGDKETP